VSEATIGIQSFLLDIHLVLEKRHRHCALGRVAGYEGGDIPFNRSFANSFTDVRITAAGHPFAIELHFQLVAAQRKDPKIVPIIFVETVDLSSDNGRSVGLGLGSCAAVREAIARLIIMK
jgi:hypothetical protein